MGKTRTENALLNSFAGFVQRIVVIITNFGAQVIFIRLLGAQYAGVSTLFTSVLTLLSFAELGIGSAITYNLYKPIADKDEKKISAYMKFYAQVYRFIALIIFTLGLLCIPVLQYIVTNVPDIHENLIIIYLLFVLEASISYLLIYKSTLLIASQNQYIVSTIQGITSIIKCIFIAMVLLLWRSYYAYLIINLSATIVQNLIISAIANKRYSFLKKSQATIDKKIKKKIFKDTYALLLYKISGVVLNGTDNIIISKYIGTNNLGVLSNYNLIINQVYNLVIQIFSSTTASIGNLAVNQDNNHQHDVFETLNFIAFWCYGFCSASLFTIITPFIRYFFGNSYTFNIAITSVLIADFYIKGIMGSVSSFRTSNGLFIQGKYRPLFMAIINIVTSIILLHYLGIIGVFIGTIFSRLVTQVWYDPFILYKIVFKRSPIRYYKKFVLWGMTNIIICVVSYSIAYFLKVESLLIDIIVRIIICIIVPNAIIIALYHKSNEFKNMQQIIRFLIVRIKSVLSSRTKYAEDL